MWNPDAGLPVIDPYTYSTEAPVVAGACLGIGLTCTGIRSDIDPAFALLYEHVQSEKEQVWIAFLLCIDEVVFDMSCSCGHSPCSGAAPSALAEIRARGALLACDE